MTLLKTQKLQGILTKAHYDFHKGLNTHAYYKIHNHAVSKDLVQDTFIKTWKYLVKGGKIDIMKAFLYHVLNNLIVDQYRKHKTVSLDALIEKGFEPSAEDFKRSFNVLDGKTALFMIQRLPKNFQKVMRMKFVQELSLKEMSQITGQRTNTLAVQIHRGLEKLKSLYHHKK